MFLLPARDIARLGIIATRRLGGAVQRNRAKRRVRELFRLNKDRVTGPSMDVVVMPRPGCGGLPFDRLESDYLAALRRHAALR